VQPWICLQEEPDDTPAQQTQIIIMTDHCCYQAPPRGTNSHLSTHTVVWIIITCLHRSSHYFYRLTVVSIIRQNVC